MTDSWSERFRVKTSGTVSKLMMYASIASLIYGGWIINTDSYYDHCLILTSTQLSKEHRVRHE
jgi:hypothetical protein